MWEKQERAGSRSVRDANVGVGYHPDRFYDDQEDQPISSGIKSQPEKKLAKKAGQVSRTEYFRTDDQTIKCGEIVVVPDETGTTTGVFVSLENYFPGAFPKPLEDTQEIIGRSVFETRNQ